MKFLILLALATLPAWVLAEETVARAILEQLVIEEPGDDSPLVQDLKQTGDPFIKEFIDSWRTGEVLLLERENVPVLVLHKVSEQYTRLIDGQVAAISDGEIESLKKVRPSRKFRRKLSQLTDTLDLASKDVSIRIDAARKLGLSQNPEYIPELEQRMQVETSPKVQRVLEESLAINKLGQTEDSEELAALIFQLGELNSLTAQDILTDLISDARETGDKVVEAAGREALRHISSRAALVDQLGNLFRGLSLGSVLLVVSFGLAITFGLMGIINMAHGEFIAIGGYTAFVVQNIFAAQFGTQSDAYQWFFVVSLPVSFIVSAGFGLVCEVTFIRFLYRRPLESLLATWGLSMVMQQAFRLMFGAANVQVNTPQYLIGNFDFLGASLSFTRIFVIIFAIITVLATWLMLTRTNLGLYIRAVMQNRQMASSLGIPVSRVNAMTFAFGCGLASMAGVILSQIGNVGPSMGQAYIVDCFMVVVAGSVGNLIGAGISAMGIGIVDQFLQPTLGPVMGKITVFAIIIFFLQWRPGGLFPTKSRSLDD